MTFTTSLNEKVQIRALFKKKNYFYIWLRQVLSCGVGSFVNGMRASLQLQHTGLVAPQHVES